LSTLPQKALFRPDEAALHLDISVKTVYRWINEGKLDAKKIGNKLIRIPRSAIFKLLKPA